MYDYLIVGAGLFGSVFARQATDAGKKVRRNDPHNLSLRDTFVL